MASTRAKTLKRGANVANTLWQCGDDVSDSPYAGYRRHRGRHGFAESEAQTWHSAGEALFRALEDIQQENEE